MTELTRHTDIRTFAHEDISTVFAWKLRKHTEPIPDQTIALIRGRMNCVFQQPQEIAPGQALQLP
jgi:hypothetical protein